MATNTTNLHCYAYEILSHLCVKINKPTLIEDSWLKYDHEEVVATEILKEAEWLSAVSYHYFGVNNEYILLPCGNPTATRHDPKLMKQFYMVHKRDGLEPAITFRIGYDKYQDLCTQLKALGFTVENSTTVVVVSKLIK